MADEHEQRRERARQRLDAGRELTPGEIAVLLGVSRSTAHQLLVDGRIRYTLTPGGHRRGLAEDVRREMESRRTVHRGGDQGSATAADSGPAGGE